jgi:hypothetical protein
LQHRNDAGLLRARIAFLHARGSGIASGDGFAAAAPVCAGERFFADLDIEILRSVDDGITPHHRSPTSASKPAGQDLGAPKVRPELVTVPLKPRANTSPFWIMLLLSLGALEHGMINAGGTAG